jgi:ribosomal protein L29
MSIEMKNIKIKQEFAIKTSAELDKLNHEELLKYIKDLQKRLVKEKPKKNSSNSSIAPSWGLQFKPPLN